MTSHACVDKADDMRAEAGADLQCWIARARTALAVWSLG